MIRELIIYLKSKRILDDHGIHWKFMEDALKESLSLISPVIKRVPICLMTRLKNEKTEETNSF